MSELSKTIVARWLREFWGEAWNPSVIRDLAAPDIVMHDPLHEPKRGRDAVAEFITDFRRAFPDLSRRAVEDPIVQNNRVVVRWEGSGTHTGPAYCGFRMGSLAAMSGRKMRFSGTTVFRVEDRYIVEELGQEDALTAMLQLGLLRIPEAVSGHLNPPLPAGWNGLPPRNDTGTGHVYGWRPDRF
jgi:predicted ester cyclase